MSGILDVCCRAQVPGACTTVAPDLRSCAHPCKCFRYMHCTWQQRFLQCSRNCEHQPSCALSFLRAQPRLYSLSTALCFERRCVLQLTVLGYILVPIFTSDRWCVPIICVCHNHLCCHYHCHVISSPSPHVCLSTQPQISGRGCRGFAPSAWLLQVVRVDLKGCSS